MACFLLSLLSSVIRDRRVLILVKIFVKIFGSVNFGKYYARAKNAEPIGLDKLAVVLCAVDALQRAVDALHDAVDDLHDAEGYASEAGTIIYNNDGCAQNFRCYIFGGFENLSYLCSVN